MAIDGRHNNIRAARCPACSHTPACQFNLHVRDLISDCWQRLLATGGRHINIRVTTLPGLQPYTHSSVAHAQAEKLKEMAHSPAQMQAYMRLSPAEKEAFLAEQISERLAVDKFLESSLCRGLRQIYQPIVDDMLNPFKVHSVLNPKS